jgi:heme/copper-type cytochrome/quinol oxidase subunit 3
MTRIRALILSYYGPTLPAVFLLLLLAPLNSEPPTIVIVLAAALMATSAVFIRVYFAMWYARQKGRSSALGWLALFGFLGWLFLIVTEDRSGVDQPEPSPGTAT